MATLTVVGRARIFAPDLGRRQGSRRRFRLRGRRRRSRVGRRAVGIVALGAADVDQRGQQLLVVLGSRGSLGHVPDQRRDAPSGRLVTGIGQQPLDRPGRVAGLDPPRPGRRRLAWLGVQELDLAQSLIELRRPLLPLPCR